MKKIVLIFLVFLIGCEITDDNDDIICTTDIRSSFIIQVRDSNDGNLSGVTIIVRDEDFEEVLQESPPNSGVTLYSGVPERPGTYIITAELTGFQTFISDPVTVEADACHVITEEITINLQSN